MAGNVKDNSVLHPNATSARAQAAVSKSKQGQVPTGRVTDKATNPSSVPKNEFFTKKSFLPPKGRGPVTKSNKV